MIRNNSPDLSPFMFNNDFLTHTCSCALLEKLPIVQLLKNFPEIYGT
jgi:hypothetical protein